MESIPSRPPDGSTTRTRVPRAVLLGVGWTCVVLGLIGVVVPGLPTTSFLIIAAWCFIRSSESAYRWLLENRLLGPYLRDYLSGSGMPRASKVIAMTAMWTACSISAFLVPSPIGKAAIIGCAVIGSYLILIRTPTAPGREADTV